MTTAQQLNARIDKLRDALENIQNQQPCTEGGGCFYPMTDGEGNHTGDQGVDPLSVIQGMVQTAYDACEKDDLTAREADCKMEDSPKVGCDCRMCEAARAAKL